MNTTPTNYESRVRALESEGMTRSDAQAVADAQDIEEATMVTLNKGGTGERTLAVSAIQIHDLWHVAMRLQDAGDKEGSEQVLEVWLLAHDLKKHILEMEA